MIYPNKNMAFNSFMKFLYVDSGGFYSQSVYNHSRHLFAFKHGYNSFYVLYKTDFFHKFNDEFYNFIKQNPEFRGLGEDINVEWLNVAISLKSDWLVFMYQSGSVYRISPLAVKKFASKHGLIRKQRKVNNYQELGVNVPKHEETVCFPIALMERMEV